MTSDPSLAPVPRRTPWYAQYAAGFLIGVMAPPGLLAAVRFGFSESTIWPVCFVLLWITIFLCLRRNWVIALIGLAIGALLSYGLLSLFVS